MERSITHEPDPGNPQEDPQGLRNHGSQGHDEQPEEYQGRSYDEQAQRKQHEAEELSDTGADGPGAGDGLHLGGHFRFEI